MTMSLHRARARRAADWVRQGQVRTAGSMDRGRFIRNYLVQQHAIEDLSSNWYTGMAIFALLTSRDTEGDHGDLAICDRAAHYIACLQRTLVADQTHYGAINEEHPWSGWCHPRDALSAAWGLLRLHQRTGRTDLLERCRLFAQWHRTQTLRDGYPVATIRFDGPAQPIDGLLASCQGGSALFYLDLHQTTGEAVYLETMHGILRYFTANFFTPAGGLAIRFDAQARTRHMDMEGQQRAWCDMHRYNDDFALVAALAAHRQTGDLDYLDYARSYLDWLVDEQHADGSFGAFRLAVSSCVAALNLLNGYLATGNTVYRAAAYQALQHLAQSQIDRPEDPTVDGGILGMAPNCDVGAGTIDLRVTTYAVITYLLFDLYETQVLTGRAGELTAQVTSNPMYPGLLWQACT